MIAIGWHFVISRTKRNQIYIFVISTNGIHIIFFKLKNMSHMRSVHVILSHSKWIRSEYFEMHFKRLDLGVWNLNGRNARRTCILKNSEKSVITIHISVTCCCWKWKLVPLFHEVQSLKYSVSALPRLTVSRVNSRLSEIHIKLCLIKCQRSFSAFGLYVWRPSQTG